MDLNNRRRLKSFRSARNDINEEDIHLCYECSHHSVTIKYKKEDNKHKCTWTGFIYFYGQIQKLNRIL